MGFRNQIFAALNACRQTTARWALALSVSATVGAACGPVTVGEPSWPPMAKEWYDRASGSFRTLDTDDAEEAIEKALKLQPQREEVRLLAARIALSDLDFDSTLKHTEGLSSAEALGLRGRALWYGGRITEAADALEQLLAYPDVRDGWAEGVVKLARRGTGRKPFTVKGSLLAVTEMPRLNSTAMLVPVEMNGQPVLGMINTGTAEVVIDSSGGREPSWVSLRFDRRVEVKDVPALTRDLSGLSRELNAPVKVLLGTNLLRHLNATFDFLGRQFVVRTFEAPPPPDATKIPLRYIRGGGMVFRGQIGADEQAESFALMIDTGSNFPLVLDEPAWKRTSVDLNLLRPVPGNSSVKQAALPRLQLGAFGLPNVPAVSGVPIDKLEQVLDIELDGLMGSGLLSAFRVTLADGGRTMWLEDAPDQLSQPRQRRPEPQPEAQPPAG